MEPFVLLLSPFAPHLAEELWERLGHAKTLAYEPWPQYDSKYLVEEEVEIAVQVSGKVRARLVVPRTIPESELKKVALEHETVKQFLDKKKIKNVFVVPGRLVNVVVE